MTDVFVSFLRIFITLVAAVALVLGAFSIKGRKHSTTLYTIGKYCAFSSWVVLLIEIVYLAMLNSGCLG